MSVLNPTPPRVGRVPTSDEQRDYGKRFPSLAAFRVTDDPTEDYNCVSWTLGIIDDWIWPEHSGTITTTDDFDVFYSQFGYVPVNTASILSVSSSWRSQADIALYATNGDCTHVARITSFDPWWESKLGAGIRMVHLLTDLRGKSYGQVVRFYKQVPGEHPDRVCGSDAMLALELAPSASDLAWGEVAATMLEPIQLSKVTAFSEDKSGPIKEAFAAAFQAWSQRVKQPDIMLQSNPKYFIDIPEFKAIVALGEPALPFIVSELEDGVFWLNYAMERITRVSPPPNVLGERRKSQWWLIWWSNRR